MTVPAKVPAPDSVFLHTNAPPTAWIERLQEVFPPSEQVPYLWLDWLPGWPEHPIQRWAIWEITPPTLLRETIKQKLLAAGLPSVWAGDLDRAKHYSMEAGILLELQGPSPRDPSNGHWLVRNGERRWRPHVMIDYDQWRIHRTSGGGYPQLFWIIQGTKGGHKAGHLTAEEEQILKTQGVARPRLPGPGELPYAPFDERVVRMVVARDRLRHWRSQKPWGDRTIEEWRRDRAEEKVEARRALSAWLTEQMEDATDKILSITDLSGLPRHEGPHPDYEKAEEQFLHDEEPTG